MLVSRETDATTPLFNIFIVEKVNNSIKNAKNIIKIT